MGENGILKFRYSGFLIKTIVLFIFFVNAPVVNCGVLTTDGMFFDFQNTTLKKSFQQISEKTGCNIEISENLLDVDVTVKFQFHDIDQALKRTLKCAGVENYIIIESKDGKLYEIYAVTDNPEQKKIKNTHFVGFSKNSMYHDQKEKEPDPFDVIIVEPTEDIPGGVSLAEIEAGITEEVYIKPDPSAEIVVAPTAEIPNGKTLEEIENDILEEIYTKSDTFTEVIIEPTEDRPGGVTLSELEAGITDEIGVELDPATVIMVASTNIHSSITLAEIEAGIKNSGLEEMPDFSIIINSSIETKPKGEETK